MKTSTDEIYTLYSNDSLGEMILFYNFSVLLFNNISEWLIIPLS